MNEKLQEQMAGFLGQLQTALADGIDAAPAAAKFIMEQYSLYYGMWALFSLIWVIVGVTAVIFGVKKVQWATNGWQKDFAELENTEKVLKADSYKRTSLHDYIGDRLTCGMIGGCLGMLGFAIAAINFHAFVGNLIGFVVPVMHFIGTKL